jgi:membrane protease YdiL (CAAX protease family)
LVLGVILSVLVLLVPRLHVGLSALGYRRSRWGRVVGTVGFGLIAAAVGVGLVEAAFSAFFPAYHLQGNAKQIFPSSLRTVGLQKQLLILAWVAVEVPLAEETLFRGIVYQGLRHVLRRWLSYRQAVLGAALVSGFIFALLHYEPHTLPILLVVGVILAYVFELSGTIAGSVALHGLVNGLQVVLLMRGLS